MTARLRVLERRLVRQRAEIEVSAVVDDYLFRWDTARRLEQTPPGPFQFVGALLAAGYYLPTAAAATNYLEHCHHKDLSPNPDKLFRVLLPFITVNPRESER